MDGVVADFEAWFLEGWRKQHPDKTPVALEERNTFYLTDQYPQEHRSLVHQIYSAPKFFRNIPPIKGSIEALHEMDKMGLQVLICTSPLKRYQHCVPEKYEWVEAQLGKAWTGRVIMTRDKTIVRADYLIDDNPDIRGLDTPTWEHIIYDQPYNRHITDKRRLTWDNWKAVLLGK
jgi:5'-nucleotidase